MNTYAVTIWFQPENEPESSFTIPIDAEDEQDAIRKAEEESVLGYSVEEVMRYSGKHDDCPVDVPHYHSVP